MLECVRREVEALRIVAPLLADASDHISLSNHEIVWKDATTGLPIIDPNFANS